MATEVQKDGPDFRVLDDLREARSCERLKNCCLMSCNELMQELMWDSVHQRTAEQTTDAVAQAISQMEIGLEILRRIYDIPQEETDFRVRIELERISHLLENEREKTAAAWNETCRKYEDIVRETGDSAAKAFGELRDASQSDSGDSVTLEQAFEKYAKMAEDRAKVDLGTKSPSEFHAEWKVGADSTEIPKPKLDPTEIPELAKWVRNY